MAKLFSKCLGKIVLMAAAVLVACGDDGSSACPDGGESSAVEESSSSWNNPKLVHPWDTKKFFDGKPDGNLLEKKEKRRLDSLRDTGRLIDSGVTALYGVYVADSIVFANASAKKPPNSKGLVEFPDREKIQVAEESSLDKESVFNVLAFYTPGLRHIYSIKYLMKNPDKHFDGEIVFRLTIVADGSIKDIKIISSTTDYTEFDGEIQKAVGRWKFPKVKSGETVVTFPVRFYENTEWSSSSQSK